MREQLILAAVLAAAAPARAQDEPTGSWADETSAFYFARGGVATDGTYLYLFGGYQLGVSSSYPSYYRRARRYDPAADSWTTLANLPIVVTNITYQYNAGAYYDGRLYSFGSSYDDGSGIVLSYSIAENTWSVLQGATLPENRYGAAAAALGGGIYIAGGFTDAPSHRVDFFNPADNTFTRVADLPVGLHLHAMTAFPARESLFVAGGVSEEGFESGCYEYSPAADAWTARASMPTPRGSLAAFTLRSRVYATGGRSDSGSSSAVFEYHPPSDTWTPRASMASARYNHAAVAIGGRGYVYGGQPVYTEGEVFTPPDLGSAPELQSPIVMTGNQPESSLQATSDPSIRDGWTRRMVTWTAMASDPDPGDQVRLHVRIWRLGQGSKQELKSQFKGEGLHKISLMLLFESSYDWEYRFEDAAGNSYPPGGEWLPAFGNDFTPDIRCNFTPPTDPVALYPTDFDVKVGDPESGAVLFGWTESTDDGPGLSYDVEIVRDGSEEPEIALSVPAGPGEASIDVPVLNGLRRWRIRARDIAGNVSGWSPWHAFRVSYDDGVNHAAGDGEKTCVFGAVPRPSSGGAALLLAGSIVHFLLWRRARKPMNY